MEWTDTDDDVEEVVVIESENGAEEMVLVANEEDEVIWAREPVLDSMDCDDRVEDDCGELVVVCDEDEVNCVLDVELERVDDAK